MLTRDATGVVVSYVDGNAGLTFLDSGNDAVIGSVLNFFIDDFVATGEASSGFVDYIQIYDTALGQNEIGGGVPEPTSWAMMIAGFGLVGAAMRRRAAVMQAA